MRDSVIVSVVLVVGSILGFLIGGYAEQATLTYMVVFAGSLILAFWFAIKLPAGDLATLGLSSFILAVVVETTMATAGLWSYISSNGMPLRFIRSQPRNDQDEEALLPRMRVNAVMGPPGCGRARA